MGKLMREFLAFHSGAAKTATGRIDTGADRTVLQLRLARRLGFDPEGRRPTEVMIVANGERTRGYQMPVCLTIGKRSACVNAFVPEKEVDIPNLIGSDFLQQSHASLDYSKPDDQAFDGLDGTFRVGGGSIRFESICEPRSRSRKSR